MLYYNMDKFNECINLLDKYNNIKKLIHNI